jgi:AdoMet-dependent heme synthase
MNNALLKAPLTINWALNNTCNFQCRHCYSRKDPSGELSTEQLCACIGKAAKLGVMAVNFGGGEPMLRDGLCAIASHAASCGMRVSMNSNGSLIDADSAAALKAAGFYKVGISIDSHLPQLHDDLRGMPGSHRQACAALKHLQDAGIRTSISSVICRINYRDIEELVAFALDLGVDQLNFHNFKCVGLGMANKDELDLSAAEWKELYSQALAAKKRVAGLDISLDDPIIASLGIPSASMVKGSVCGKLSLNIKTNGDITPCGFIPSVIGNITNDDLGELWRTSKLLDAMRHKKATGKCGSCSHYDDCLGGCSARALAMTGDLNSPDPHCWA